MAGQKAPAREDHDTHIPVEFVELRELCKEGSRVLGQRMEKDVVDDKHKLADYPERSIEFHQRPDVDTLDELNDCLTILWHIGLHIGRVILSEPHCVRVTGGLESKSRGGSPSNTPSSSPRSTSKWGSVQTLPLASWQVSTPGSSRLRALAAPHNQSKAGPKDMLTE